MPLKRKLIVTATLAVGAVATTLYLIRPSTPEIEPDVTPVEHSTTRGTALAQARRSYDKAALDAFIADQEKLAASPGANAEVWRILADAYLERVLWHTARKGMRVGEPSFTELPPHIERDLDAGLDAIEKSKALDAEVSDTYRIEAGLLGQKVTGLMSALRLTGRMNAALEKAVTLDPTNPDVHVALGCRKLFSPPSLGHDPTEAKRYLLQAAAAMPLDERPLCFAAMAAFLEGDAEESLELLRRAVERNSANEYAREVLRRLEAGEDQAFERDLGS